MTLDSLAPLSPADSTQTDPPEPEAGEHAENGALEEAPVSQINSAEVGFSEQNTEERNVAQFNGENGEMGEELEVSTMDHESLDASPLCNRFTVLSEDQHPEQNKSSDLEDGNVSETGQEVVDEVRLTDEMDKMSLNEGSLDPEAVEDEIPDEPKEYTVVNQDPELAFSTLATRTTPEKQECSVQSCLFQFTEVENLTQTNRLLCVTCTKRNANKNNSDGIYDEYSFCDSCFSPFTCWS